MKIYTEEELTKKINQKNMIRIIMRCILYPIIFLIVIVNIFLIAQRVRNPKAITQIFGYKFLVITSGSMQPNLNVDDLIIIKETTQNNIQKNNIITFRDSDRIITHRIINILKENGTVYYETQGDNNNAPDENFITYENVEGIYVAKIPKVGEIASKTKSTPFIIIAIFTLYIIYKIVGRVDDKRILRHKKREKLEESKKEK